MTTAIRRIPHARAEASLEPRRTKATDAGRCPMRASLVIADGPAAGECFHLGRRTFVIGRAETCTVQVLDRRASRKHCRVRYCEQAGRHVLEDVGSLNGTRVNDEATRNDLTLRDGDVITVGRTRIVYFEGRFLDGAAALLRWRRVGERQMPTLPPTAA